MFAGRVHMLITVLSMINNALFIEKKLPYFPIELSRMAASGPTANLVFRCCTLLPTTYVFDGPPSPTTLLLCLSIAIVALFDDVRSLAIHMLGVLGIFYCACIQAYNRPVLLYTCLIPACIIYIVRIILKGLVVHFLERKQNMATLCDVDVQRGNVIYGADIMYGRKKAKYTETTMIFILGGFLQ